MSSPKFMRKALLLASAEATKAVDALPTGVNAILVGNLNLQPLEGDVVQRNNIQPFFGAQGDIMVTYYAKVSFEVEAAGVATAGDEPGYAPLLRACGCSMTINAGVDVRFAPVSDGLESATIYVYLDGLLHKMVSGMGTVTLAGDAKTLPKFNFDFTGCWARVEDAAAVPAATYTAFMTPLGVNKTNSTLQLHGRACNASAFSFDIGNTVIKRDLIGVDSVEITDRASTGSVTFEAGPVVDYDWVEAARTSTAGPLHFVHGQGANNVVEITAPNVQLGKPTYAESDGVLMITTPLTYKPGAAGNDEWEIIVR